MLRDSIIHALQSGYRLIDTAQSYGVEAVVGEAIRASGVPREDIIVVTKLWGDSHRDPAAALERSMTALDIGYIDVFLMHWPNAINPESRRPDESQTFVETWKLMEKLVEPGSSTAKQCKTIGVSNFTQKTLDVLLRETTVVPVVNQVELHALNPNPKLVPYCQDRGIQVMGWSTLGSRMAPEILTHPLFIDLAKKHSTTPAVISLSWAIQRNVIVIPKSGSLSRIEENINLITLPSEDMETMNNAHKTVRPVRLSDSITSLQYDIPGKGKTLMGWTPVEFGFEDEQGNWLV